MATSKGTFSSLQARNIPPIIMGDDTPIKFCGKGRVDLDNGCFKNVLNVPKVSINIVYFIKSLTLVHERRLYLPQIQWSSLRLKMVPQLLLVR